MKIDEQKDHHPICHLGEMFDSVILFKPASIMQFKDSQQFARKIQVKYYEYALNVKETNKDC